MDFTDLHGTTNDELSVVHLRNPDCRDDQISESHW